MEPDSHCVFSLDLRSLKPRLKDFTTFQRRVRGFQIGLRDLIPEPLALVLSGFGFKSLVSFNGLRVVRRSELLCLLQFLRKCRGDPRV